MAYRDNKLYDFRLVKSMTNSPLTIDLGKTFGGTITAYMKTNYDDTHYREFTVVDNRYLTLTKNETVDWTDNGVVYPIEGRWYVTVWQVGGTPEQTEVEAIYTGKILFIGSMNERGGTSGGIPVDENDIWYFQYDNPTYDISNIDLIDTTFLASNGQLFTADQLEVGQNIINSNIGRYGFYVALTTIDPPYTIHNIFGGDITSSFDYILQGTSAYYVSKEIAIPSTIYFKLTQV